MMLYLARLHEVRYECVKVTRVSVGESRQMAEISVTVYLILLPALRQVINAWHISRYFSSSF